MKRVRRACAHVAAGLALLVTSPTVGWGEEIQPLAFTDFGGVLALELLYETERAESETRDQEFRELTFIETLGFFADGYVYHPNLLDFDVGLDLGLGQERERGDIEEDRTTEIIGYDVHLAVEKNRPYGFDLSALRDHEILEQEFAPNSIVDVTAYNLIWQIQNRFLPTSANFSFTTEEQSGITERKEEESRITVQSSHRLGELARTRIRYDFRDFTEEEVGIERENHDFSVLSNLTFGDERDKRMTSSLRYRTESGTTEIDQLVANTRLGWPHTKNLESFYYLNVNDTTVSPAEEERIETFSHSEEIGFRHKLYENLITEVTLDNRGTDSDTFEQQAYGSGISFNYMRPIPIGRVDAHLGYSLRRTDESAEGGLLAVVDESHQLLDPIPAFLENVNVDLGSIVVTHVDGVPVYTEGIHYTLVLQGDRVGIKRVLGGGISDGQEVLVDYFFEREGDLKFDTDVFGAGVGLGLFDGWRVSYRLNSITHDFISGDHEESGIQDIITRRVDLSYSKEDPSGVHYGIESFYEDRDLTFSPAESFGFIGQFGRPVWQRNEATLSASYTESRFPDTHDETDMLTLTTVWTSRFTPVTRLALQGIYTDIGGTLDDQTGVELKLLFETVFRLLNISLEITRQDVSDLREDRQTNLVYLKLTRRF